MTYFLQRATPVLALCLAPVALAFAGATDPTQVAPHASLSAYRSAFSDYKPLAEDEPGDWRALNDAVKDGGRAHRPGSGQGPHGGMPGGGQVQDHAMPTALPKTPVAAGAAKARGPAAAAPVPAMKGMSEQSVHDMPGGKP